MKVGILTHQSIPNYGACFQAACTVHALRQLGHSPLVFDLSFESQAESARTRAPAGNLALFQEFCRSQLPLSEPCTTSADLVRITERMGLDAVLIGSDAIFRVDREARPGSHVAFPSPFWGEWTAALDVRLYALAGSAMGTLFPRLSGSVLKGMRSALRNFDTITVRDRWTQMMVGVVGGVGSHLCPDPTVLAGDMFGEEGERPADLDAAVRGRPYVVVSFNHRELSVDQLDALYHGLGDAGFAVCGIPHPDDAWFEIPCDWHPAQTLTPREWYRVLMGAAGYVGSRFHPVVMSMNAGIPFVSVDFHGGSLFHSGPLRLRSKTYDYCRQRKLGDRVLAVRSGSVRFSVDDYLRLLTHWPRERVRTTCFDDRRHFYDVLESMVGRAN